MRVLLTFLLLNSSLYLFGQSINQKELYGCWEVKRIDNKIFQGGVITYFEFTDDQLLFAKTKDNKEHGVLKNNTLIGKYKIKNNLLIIEEQPNTYRLSFKENKDSNQELIMEELALNTQKIIQTSYLIKWKKQ